MRIRTVRAKAFGPLENAELDLAPGMTVIAGPNEAGKSTWHAAIYAALCGIRRGRGRPTRDDELFAARHKPWDGDRWEVEAVVELPGRMVELYHDLSGRVDCGARDLTLGTDVSAEIIHDGSPDGSRWLGLDRRSFLAIACVRQAEILAVSAQAGALQDHLQRAAATAGADETASAALALLREFRTEHVGTLRANSTRPRMLAHTRLRRAQQRRDDAEQEHGAWLALTEQASRLESSARQRRRHLAVAEAQHQRALADTLAARAREARSLADALPARPADLGADDELADQVGAALSRWQHRPNPVAPTGPTVAELDAQLDALPAEPVGDVDVDPEPRRRAADDRRRSRRQFWGVAAVGLVCLLVGAGLLAVGQIALGAAVVTAGVLLSAAGAWIARRRGPHRRPPGPTSSSEWTDEPDREHRVATTLLHTRRALEQARAARAEQNRRFRDELASVAAARAALVSAAASVGIDHDIGHDGEGDDDTAADALADRLIDWQRARHQRRQRADAARQAWTRLDTLLGGRDLDALELEATRAATRADELEQAAPGAPAVDLGADPERTIAALRADAADAVGLAQQARTELHVRAEHWTSVPEAEEELAAARAELDRIDQLDRVLELTEQRLEVAQDQVHRDLAPRLRAKVRERLARVTSGRYTDVAINPDTLGVQVRDHTGRWRNAALASHGTAEQVYLLVRVAMAELLTASGARSPLLLDDVTVQADTERTNAIMDVLHEVSHDHQVIVFTQEDSVVAWAKDRLRDRDALVHLPAATTS